MRTTFPLKLEIGRITSGPYGSLQGSRAGAFVIMGPCSMELKIIANDAYPESDGWEHVSVSGHRCPNWEEMCYIKDLFWDEEETVLQVHPPKSRYVSHHPTCLHLWKGVQKLELPPMDLVGPKTMADFNRLRRMVE